jgi:hypothetical protein
VNLPRSNSFDSILVVVDHFTKMVHFVPCNKSIISEKITKLFFNHFFAIMGFLKISFLIMDPDLHPSFGSGFSTY